MAIFFCPTSPVGIASGQTISLRKYYEKDDEGGLSSFSTTPTARTSNPVLNSDADYSFKMDTLYHFKGYMESCIH